MKKLMLTLLLCAAVVRADDTTDSISLLDRNTYTLANVKRALFWVARVGYQCAKMEGSSHLFNTTVDLRGRITSPAELAFYKGGGVVLFLESFNGLLKEFNFASPADLLTYFENKNQNQ